MLWPGQLEVGVGADAAAGERADEAALELAGARLDERAAGVDSRGVDEGVGDGGAEGGLDLDVELRADALLDVGAELVERVELGGGARQLVVEPAAAPSP